MQAKDTDLTEVLSDSNMNKLSNPWAQNLEGPITLYKLGMAEKAMKALKNTKH